MSWARRPYLALCAACLAQCSAAALRSAPPVASVRPTPQDCSEQCVARAEALAETTPKEAVEVIQGCLACAPVAPAAYLLAADLFDGERDDASARRTLREGTARFPRSAALWEALSRYELSAGRPAAALEALGRAYRLRPGDPRLARAYRDLVARHGSQEERARPKVTALIDEAAGRFAIGDLDRARAALVEALEASGQVPSLRAGVHLRLALLSIEQRRWSEAQRSLDAGRRDAPSDVRADIELAQAELALRRGRYRRAEEAAEAALAARPDDPLAYINLSLARAHRSQWRTAVEALQRALTHGLPERLTRAEVDTLLATVAWGPVKNQVDQLIDQAWR